ncbi:proteasome-type protease [Parachitinimonas caeni]|uniref:Proteasome-type protease n=1 Tax=Parachitinimonas caeni TaxID=3031301 RepID=A0ABT7E128_9NEIS|nr:proteasome-type protease [Parachitinimonas caeni]MDK2125110.1 proteasome-type protease [Parachitinimonas caeni]
MRLAEGLIFASDTRTNAGVDHIATFRKMHVFEQPGDRLIVLLTSGNLATSQSVVGLLRHRCGLSGDCLLTVPNLYQAAVLVGATVREILARDSFNPTAGQSIDFGCSILLGGQIQGEEPGLFNIYPQGNFIEASVDTPYFQIGEAKYGKPIIDRVLRYQTPLKEAAKCTLISFDSTVRSNLSVGLPIDMMLYRTGSFTAATICRIDGSDPYFNQLRKGWGEGLRKVFAKLPDADWF